jgi:hypothetical protein
MSGESFSVLRGKRDGRDAIVVVDTALDRARLAARYPYLLTITLPIRRPNAFGLCDNLESERWGDVEDRLLDALPEPSYRYAGRVTCNGVREVLLYTADPEDVTRRLRSEAARLGPSEAVALRTAHEPSWETLAGIVG